jgi:hypothetical protein
MIAVTVACTGHAATPNASSASVGPPISTSAPSSPQPTPSSPYPADVPLTGHNVKPGEKPPLYPAAASSRSEAGANAFAEFFMRTLDWAYATTNPSYMKHYYASSCGLCSGLATGITKTAAAGHWFLGDRLTVHPAQATAISPVTAPSDFCSIVRIDETSFSTVDKTGKVFTGDGAHVGDKFKICAKATSSQSWQVSYLAGLG